MTIIQLHYFIATVDLHSVSRVAEHFHVTQPAVSSAIRNLESELQVKLFFRANRELTLTQPGIEFYQKACSLVRHFDSVLADMRNMNNGDHTCSIAIPRNIAPIHLPGLYRYLTQHIPDIKLTILEDQISNILKMLQNGTLDIACIGHNFDLEPPFQLHRVWQFSLSLCVNPRLASFPSNKVTVKEVEKIPLILYREGTTHNTYIRALYERAGCTPNILFEVSQLRTMEEVICQGLAAGFLPKQLFQKTAGIQTYEMDGWDSTPVYLVHKRSTDLIDLVIRHSKAYFKSVKD